MSTLIPKLRMKFMYTLHLLEGLYNSRCHPAIINVFVVASAHNRAKEPCHVHVDTKVNIPYWVGSYQITYLWVL